MRRPSTRTHLRIPAAALTAVLLLVAGGCGESEALASPNVSTSEAPTAAPTRTLTVSGSAIHFFSTAVSHSEEAGPAGSVQRTTDIIRLMGDLDGFVLYHPTTVIDFAAGTLVNTGTQLFSGTVAGEGPVILHDDTFRFEVQLESGETRGTVHLGRSLDAPHRSGWFECDLEIVGTGMTPEGDGLADYSGSCRQYGTFSGKAR